MATESNDRLDRARSGDGDALAALLREHGPRVRQRIRGRIGSAYQSAFDEDDVMQVTYLEAFLGIERFSPVRGAGPAGGFPAWLTRIAENNLRDAIKGLRRSKRPPRDRQISEGQGDDSYVSLLAMLSSSPSDPRSASTPSRAAVRAEAEQILETSIKSLPPDYERVVRLYDLERLEIAEVARLMEKSLGSIYMLRARALARLRGLLPSESKFFTRTP